MKTIALQFLIGGIGAFMMVTGNEYYHVAGVLLLMWANNFDYVRKEINK